MIKTKLGMISGFKEDGIDKYYGIPFAKAPIGELRFRRPAPLDPWEGIFEATKLAKNPMQFNQFVPFEKYSEDCLYVNVWVPEHKEGEKLPVMVWIPGGAYELGGANSTTGSEPDYECSVMARDTGCIVVSVTYRLNLFGFLNFGKYSKRFEDNLGMWDCVAGLQWINENIEAFGGDPKSVTLFGESAGAGAISALLMIDEAKPYFQRAIMESNCWECYHDEELEDIMVKKYLELVGLITENVDDLLAMPYDRLFKAVNALDMFMCQKYFLRCTYAPVVDGKFLKAFPTLDSLNDLDKDVIVGSNHNEGNYQSAIYLVSEANSQICADLMFQYLSPEQKEKLYQYYDLPKVQAMSDIFTDVLYMFPKIQFAEHVAKNSKAKVYVYRYDHVTPYQKKVNLLACHISELLPLFDCHSKSYKTWMEGDEEILRQIGLRMRRYWGAFARTGKPAVDGQDEWKPYDEKNRYTLLISDKDVLASDPEKDSRIQYAQIDKVLIK